MLLVNAQVKVFKSIEDSGSVSIDPYVTVLVGQNEAGKTAFLQALHKAKSIDKSIKYDVIEDYPRKSLTRYEAHHEKSPATVAVLTYQLQEHEISRIKENYGIDLSENFQFSLSYNYSGGSTIGINIPEKPYVQRVVAEASLPSEIAEKAASAESVAQLISMLEAADLNEEGKVFLGKLNEEFKLVNPNWTNKLESKIWIGEMATRVPQFLYFDDYYLLPGKINLPALQQRVAAKALKDEDKTVLSLLRAANVELSELLTPTGYEKGKAKLEAISISITDKIFEFWTQNQNLDVEIDIKPDPEDEAPFDSGNNLYIRIRNRRHRVSVPFSQRSKGFIWFFSFIVWFDGIKEQLDTNADLILLLDEPGLSLHALGQADLLRYIDHLAENHQILYSTHSPFMVHGGRLHQTRTVQDTEQNGTTISNNVSGSDPKTLFPLQAALGYTIAQNLFISARNLLVEGPADLIYLKFFSTFLETHKKTSLRDDVTIVPVGGLDKLATFVALLGGNKLEMAVLHDYESKPDPHLQSLIREKLIRDKQVLNYAMFRQVNKKTGSAVKASSEESGLISSDVEDMISPETYLKIFNAAYKKQLNGIEIKEADLPEGDRIVLRITRYLADNAIQLRPSGGFNHYLPASHLASNPPAKVDAATLNRFEKMFEAINALYSD